jgi:hypothetical protein
MENTKTAATRPIYYTPPAALDAVGKGGPPPDLNAIFANPPFSADALRAENEKAAGLRGCGRTFAWAALVALCGAALFVVAGIVTRLILEALP